MRIAGRRDVPDRRADPAARRGRDRDHPRQPAARARADRPRRHGRDRGPGPDARDRRLAHPRTGRSSSSTRSPTTVRPPASWSGRSARRRLGVDTRTLGMIFEQERRSRRDGAGAAVLGANPYRAVAWLANTLAADGLELHAGDVIMPGALCAMVPVARGDVASADFGVLGTVSVRFASPYSREKSRSSPWR